MTTTMKAVLLVPLLFITIIGFSQVTDYNKKLNELGIKLIEPTKPIANYVKAVRSDNLIFLAGHGPTRADGFT
jgi:enamine deaminase RidA (YjgF/YER057c/UK114 family)